jgi:cadmium resistance protein CadD (predicted permease)
MIETIVTSILAFISTNIDDIFILMMLFTQQSASFNKKHIIAGQFIGIIALITLSMAGVLIGILFPPAYLGLLGLFPIYLGMKQLYQNFLKKHDGTADKIVIPSDPKNSSAFFVNIFSPATLSVSAITIANGGDNIGIYIPLFSMLGSQQLIMMIGIFLCCTYCWLRLAQYLTSHPRIASTLKKKNLYLFPIVLIALGIYIFIESNTFSLLRF